MRGSIPGHCRQDAARRYPQEGGQAPRPPRSDRRQVPARAVPACQSALANSCASLGDPRRRSSPASRRKTVIGMKAVIDAAHCGALGRNTPSEPSSTRTTVRPAARNAVLLPERRQEPGVDHVGAGACKLRRRPPVGKRPSFVSVARRVFVRPVAVVRQARPRRAEAQERDACSG